MGNPYKEELDKTTWPREMELALVNKAVGWQDGYKAGRDSRLIELVQLMGIASELMHACAQVRDELTEDNIIVAAKLNEAVLKFGMAVLETFGDTLGEMNE